MQTRWGREVRSVVIIDVVREKTMFLQMLPYVIIAVLLVAIAFLLVSLRVSRKLVTRLMLDDVFHAECRTNLFFRGIDDARHEQRLQGMTQAWVDDPRIQATAWWVAATTETDLQKSQRSERPCGQRDLSLT